MHSTGWPLWIDPIEKKKSEMDELAETAQSELTTSDKKEDQDETRALLTLPRVAGFFFLA